MTVPSSESFVTLGGNGATTAFNFSFIPASNVGTLQITYTDPTGNETILSPSQYTVVLNALQSDALWQVGGTVTYPLAGSPIPNNSTLTIERILPYVQSVSIRNQGNFYAQATEQAMDLLEMQIQQLADLVEHAIQIPLTDNQGLQVVLPSAVERAGKYVAFDLMGNVIVSSGTGSGGGGGTVTTLTQGTGIILNPNPITGAGSISVAASGVTAGAYTNANITLDATGRVLSASSGLTDAGFTNFVIPPLVAPAVPGSGLVINLPAGQAVLNSTVVPIPALVNITLPDNSYIDYYLNPNGTWTVAVIASNNYINAVRYPTLVHVWNITTGGGKILSNYMVSRTRPVIPRTNNLYRVTDQIPVMYSIGIGLYTPMAFTSGMALTYGQVFYTTTGRMYQCFTQVGGNAGTVAPTFTAPGLVNFGSIQIGYYGDYSFVGGARYAPNNGIQNYFANLMAQSYCDLVGTSGTLYSTVAKNYILNLFKHCIAPWQASSTYSYGQKVVAGGYIWLNITFAGGTTGGSSPFSGSYTQNTTTNPFNGSQVTDNTITWLCIYPSFGSPAQQYMWMETDPTMLIYIFSDAHDSEATGLFDLLWEYVKVTGDWQWLNTASPIPNQTYAALLQNIYYYNMGFLVNGLTPTFQQSINPQNGSSFTTQYFEDNTQSYRGYQAAQVIFTLLGNSTYAALAAGGVTAVNSALLGMSSFTLNVSGWYYGDNLSWYGNTQLQWYPWYQAQFFAEYYQVAFATDAFKQGAMQYVMQFWNNWPEDPGPTPGLPLALMGYMAAKYWQNPEMAQAVIDIIETVYLANGLIASDFGYYLQTKKLLVPNNRIRRITGIQRTYEDPAGNCYIENNSRVFTGSGTINIYPGDFFVGINKASGAASAVQITWTPTTDYLLIIKDCKGDAGTNNITITPFAGNIDQAGTKVISANSGDVRLRFLLSANQWYTE